MKLKDILRDLKLEGSAELFTAEVLSNVENRFKERNGKLYVTCQIRGKEVQAKRAVEIAIEETEAAALRFLAKPLEG